MGRVRDATSGRPSPSAGVRERRDRASAPAGRPAHRWRSRVGVGTLLVVLALVPAGCATPTSRGREAALATAAERLDDGSIRRRGADVVEFARRAEPLTGPGFVMVAVEEGDTAVPNGRPIGTVTFAVTVADRTRPVNIFDSPDEVDPGPHCVEVTFERWGVHSMRVVRCPEGGIVPIDAPPSRRPHVAPNAREAIWSVLGSLTDDLPPEDQVLADVTALLEPHGNGVTPLAPVTVHVEDGSVAVATGDDEDCELVRRDPGGEVWDVHVPSVYLLPGELGCTASTAFRDLRPPH